ncbi:MAG: hypothetical protein IKS17_06155 [Firmicutes bacterium]|nr:hypothetical protein [Bacillota bacterium]
MFNEIIKGVCAALSENFEGATIYTEHVEQNFKSPAFFVFCNAPETSIKRYRGHRFLARNGVSITYIHRNDGTADNAATNDIAEKLFLCTEVISAGGHSYRATKQRLENSEGIAVFFLNYDFFFNVTDETELMRLLSIETGVSDNVGT